MDGDLSSEKYANLISIEIKLLPYLPFGLNWSFASKERRKRCKSIQVQEKLPKQRSTPALPTEGNRSNS